MTGDRYRLAPLVIGLVCAACGGGSSRPPATSGAAPSGAAVFAHSCRSCHSLVGNESMHKQGGDLLGYRFTRRELTSFTRVMPAHLTPAQLRAVVDYVLRAQAAGHG